MDDRNLMENILLLEKGACDLFLHGAIESSTQNVHSAFTSSLKEPLPIATAQKFLSVFCVYGIGLVDEVDLTAHIVGNSAEASVIGADL